MLSLPPNSQDLNPIEDLWDVLDQQIWSNKVHLTAYAEWGWEHYTDSLQLEHSQICITWTHESLIIMQTFNYTNISPMPLFIIVIPSSFLCVCMKTRVILIQFWSSKNIKKSLRSLKNPQLCLKVNGWKLKETKVTTDTNPFMNVFIVFPSYSSCMENALN